MKHFIIGLGLLTLSSLSAYSCDQCSCASSGFMGIVPQFGRHHVGLRYNYQQFKTRHFSSLIEGETLETSVERFHTTKVFGSYFPHRRIQVLASIPFTYRSQVSNLSGSFIGYGIGDMQIGGVYTPIATPDTIGKKVRHNVMFGSILKLPTGQTSLKQGQELLHRNLQSGTGSWDVDFNIRYIVRIKRWGISSLVNYRLNTTANNYKFGDRITGMLGAFYWTRFRSVTFIPQLAINADYAFRDVENNRFESLTGGYLINTRAELQVGYKRFMASVGYGLPILHNLNNGEVTPVRQCNVSLLVFI